MKLPKNAKGEYDITRDHRTVVKQILLSNFTNRQTAILLEMNQQTFEKLFKQEIQWALKNKRTLMFQNVNDLDPDQVREMASNGASMKECASFFKVERSLFVIHWQGIFDQGAAQLKMRIRQKQMEILEGGSVPMAIHLGKHYLDQKDSKGDDKRRRSATESPKLEFDYTAEPLPAIEKPNAED